MYVCSIYTGPMMSICIYRNARFDFFVCLQYFLSRFACIHVYARERREEIEVKREGRVLAYTHAHT